MPRSRKGSGSVFQRTYRDSKGKLRKTSNWYIEFVAGNRTIRESTEYTKRADAAEFLKSESRTRRRGKIVLSRNVTFDDLRKLILVDYENNGRKSFRDLQTARLPHLDAVFGGTKAIDITTTSVERYKALRLKDKAAPATINRELATLKRMFRLGLRQGMVATMPYISMLTEHNVRKGFFELDQFRAILKQLPGRVSRRCSSSPTSRAGASGLSCSRASGVTSSSAARVGCASILAKRRTRRRAESSSSRPGCAR